MSKPNIRFFSIVSILSCCFLLLLPLKSQQHPYYIGVSELHLFPSDKRIDLSIRLFTDDLELALTKTYGVSSDLLKGVKEKVVNDRIENYLLKKLNIQIDKAPVALKYIGYEIEADASWCYFEASYSGNATEIRFQNRALFDIIPEQQHIVHVNIGEKRKSTRLNHDKDLLVWQW